MVIVDEQIMKSTNDKTDFIVHKPVLFRVRPDGTHDYTPEREAYVGPLEFIVQPNLREIAGNKAFEYIQGKRYYEITNREENDEEGNGFNGFLNIGKWLLLAIALSGVAILVALHFFPAMR